MLSLKLGLSSMFRLLAAVVVLAGLASAVHADLLQTGRSRWVVLASTRDLDNAIGIANLYRHRFDDVRVAESSNGWLAVIAGPVSIARGAKAAREELSTPRRFSR
jgi:hypothetical protein